MIFDEKDHTSAEAVPLTVADYFQHKYGIEGR